jgi:S-formylglutathione hydrolase FrmB
MTVANVRFFSDALGKWTRYNVILPDEGEGPFPVLVQLHGLTDDCDAWIERSNLVRHVADMPLVVVLPDGGTSAYLNWKASDRLNKHRYEDLIVTDIPAHLKRHFNVTDGPWAIGGLSMGGYGAVRLGLKYPDRFASIYAHSSAFRIDEALRSLDEALVENVGDADVYVHAAALAERNQRPVIAFDCGVGDRLIDHNRRFHEHLQSLNIDHHYAEFEGGHEWDYWDLHVREALAQHANVLGLVRHTQT